MKIAVLGPLDATFAWDGARLYSADDLGPGAGVPAGLRGAASVAKASRSQEDAGGHGRWRFLRDPLGINKLFWGYDPAGRMVFAAKPGALIGAGIPLERVFALPPGCVLDVNPDTGHAECQTVPPLNWSGPANGVDDLEHLGARIRRSIDGFLAAIATRHPDATTFVCLSGGLDSTGIAALARRHFPNLVAVSFDLARPGGRTSEDRRAAERLSRDLRLPLLTVTATHQEIFEHLDTVLVDGIDWRDFNVHAGLVNAMLASRIDLDAPSSPGDGPRLVLTGDLANEFLSDYQPEHYKGTTYYRLPRLAGRSLRNSLVRGLATCHREVGVFAAWGLTTIQPYAVAVDDYLSLPEALFDEPDRKQQLCRAIFGDLIPGYIYARKKSRAQIGDQTGGGVLHAAVDRGVDAAALRKRFADLHGVTVERQLDSFLRAGHYRTAVPFVTREA